MSGLLTEFWAKGGLTTLSTAQLAAPSAVPKPPEWMSQSDTKCKRSSESDEKDNNGLDPRTNDWSNNLSLITNPFRGWSSN